MILAINSSKANGQNSPRIHKYSKCCDFISLLRKDVVPSVADGVATEYNLRTPCPESLGIIALDSRITQKNEWGPFTYDVTCFGGFLTPLPPIVTLPILLTQKVTLPLSESVGIGENNLKPKPTKIKPESCEVLIAESVK